MKPLCIVTGTSSGIGEAVARRLCAEGWDVMGVARRGAPFEAPGYRHVQLDLSEMERVQQFFEGTLPAEKPFSGRPRVGLVNNAAMMGPLGTPETFTPREMSQAFELNAVVPVWLMGYLARQCPNSRVAVVNISSGAAFTALSGWLTYCASKAALRMAGQAFAEDITHAGVYSARTGAFTVVNYTPGLVDTPMQDEVRRIPESVFANVKRHRDAYQKGEVKHPDLPAAEIAALLARDDLPPYLEVRYGES